MRNTFFAAAIILFASFFAASGGLVCAAPVETGNTTAELVSEVAAIAPDETFWVALKLTPRDGWHTYWRNPGDSGLPTTLEWTLPAGVTAAEIRWPVPHAVPYGPLMNFGYDSEHWLLVAMTADATLAAGNAIEINARADWLVCEDICIPEGADLTLVLPVRAAAVKDPGKSRGFREARAALPVRVAQELGYRAEEGTIVLALDAPVFADVDSSSLRFFPYAETLIRNPAPQTTVEADGKRFLVVTLAASSVDGVVNGVVAFTKDGAYSGASINAVPQTLELPVGAAMTGSGPGSGGALAAGLGGEGVGLSIIEAILFAFVGGILLNLMPCVFPVLSLKALAVVKSAGHAPEKVRREGLLYTAGIVVSFLVVAGALLAFRSAGEAVGWGFQLQSPGFIAVLALLLFTVGLSLSGYFEFGGRFTGMGQGLVEKGGGTGAFFTGVLATVVATPCTAPFMAPALGFALTQQTILALAVFVALGLGLAFPFLLVSMVPALGNRLPKPGPWMERLKQFLAFPMYATVIWLVWVLGLQVGMNGVAALLAAIMLIPFGIWLLRIGSGGGRILARSTALISLVGGIWLVVFASSQEAVRAGGSENTALPYEPYSEELLNQYRRAGEPVFVNFTAAWCITCLANEQVALATEPVEDYFAQKNVRYLKGDWTQRDPEITKALTAFGRSGVPLYLYYPAGEGDPVVLPQLLTSGIVLNELKAADRVAVASSVPKPNENGE